MKKLMVGVVVSVACAVTQAAVYYSGNGTTKMDFKTAIKWYSDAACTQQVDVYPTDENTDTWIFQSLNAKLSGGATLAEGGTYHWGDNGDGTYRASKVSYAESCNAITFNIPYCTVYGCSLSADYGAVFKFAGTYEFINCGQVFAFKCNVTAGPSAQGKSNHADLEFAGKFIGADDVDIQCNSTISAPYSAKTILSGDFSDFKGRVTVLATAGTNIVTLTSSSALGSSDEPRDDALVLRSNNKLVIGDAVDQDVGRSITFDLAEGAVAYIGTENGGSSTVSVPLNGTSGTLAKIDAGAVTLAGPVGLKSIEVREGELVIEDAAQLAEGTVITVFKGADLQYTMSQKGKFTITGEGTSGMIPVVVPYDSTWEPQTQPVTLPEGFDPEGEKIRFRLSQPIALPVNEALTLDVLKIPNGNYSADDFVDLTERLLTLPKVALVLDTTSEPGVQIVRLNVNPAITFNAGYKTTEAATQTDGKAMHDDGVDYYLANGAYGSRYDIRTGTGSNIASWGLDKGRFVLAKGKINDYCANCHFGDLRVYGGGDIVFVRASSSSYADRAVAGHIYLDSSCTETSPLVVTCNASMRRNEICAQIVGTGLLKLTNNDGGTDPVTLRITGDNSEWSGPLWLTTGGGSKFTYFSVTNAAAFGRGDATPNPKAIWLDIGSYSNIKCVTVQAENSMTVDDANRGWTVTRGTLRQVEGATFTLLSPLTVTGALSKDGAGTLALGGAVSADGKPLQVDEGFVQPVNVTSYAGFDVTFADGAGIALDAALSDTDLIAKGLVVKSVALAEGGRLKVELRNWKPLAVRDGSVKRAILTVPAETPDLTDSIELLGKGAVRELSHETEDGVTTYFATYSQSGMTIFVR